MTGGRKIAKNAVYLAGTNGLNLAVALTFAALTSRYFGITVFGQMGLVFFVTTFFEGAVRGGISTVLTQRVAQNPELAEAYWWPSLILHGAFGLLCAALATAAAWILGAEPRVVAAVLIASCISGARLVGESAIGIQRGLDRMDPEFWTTIFERTLFMGLLLAVMLRYPTPLEAVTWGFLALFAANAFTQTVQSGLLLGQVWRRLRPPFRLDAKSMRDLIDACRPLWLVGLLIALHCRLEVFMLQRFSTKVALGTFVAAVKVPDTMRILPWFLCMAIFPALSRHAAASNDRFQETYGFALRMLALLAAPLALALFLLSHAIVRLLYPASFGEAATLLEWIPLGIVPMFINSLFNYGAVALEKQALLVRIYLGTLVIQGTAGYLLIRYLGALGAAYSFVGGEAVLMAISLAVTIREIAPVPARDFVPPIALTSATLGLLAILGPRAPLAVLPLAMAGGALVASSTFTRSDLRKVRAVLRPEPAEPAG